MEKITGIVLAAAIMAIGSSAVYAGQNEVVDIQGIKFEIPEDIQPLVTVSEDDPDMVVSVYETASVEAAEAQGDDYPGAGWLFGINIIPESEMQRLRCGAMDGMIPFAEDDYVLHLLPSDRCPFCQGNNRADEGGSGSVDEAERMGD